MIRFPIVVSIAALCSLSLLSGCGSGPLAPATNPPVAGNVLQGRVHGGQQSVSNGRIGFYAAGLSGPGAGAVDLLAGRDIRSDANGEFTITGAYICPSATAQVYVVARGGNPGLTAGTDNPALELVSALGDCGALTPATVVNVDEVSTVAAAWSLAQFFGANSLAGASATNTTGLRNAFLTVRNLVDPATGTSPGALPFGGATETAKINTLANALAPCINSDGSQCAALFAAASASGTSPANTFDAALAIIRHPAANVSAVFNLAAALAPFQPALATPPADWTLSLTYGLCSAGCGGLNLPGALALDSSGNAWVANYFGGVVSKFSPAGSALTPYGYAGRGLRQSFGVAVDPFGSVWVSNENSVRAANNSGFGSMSKFTADGSELSGYGYTGGGIYYPQGIASDTLGNLWVADYGDSSATLLANDGSALSPGGGYAASALPFTSAIAVDAAGSAWFAVQQGAAHVTQGGALTRYPCCNGPQGVATEPGGNLWLADYGAASLVHLDSAGNVLARVADSAGRLAAQGIALDGAGNVWAANFRGNSITELASGTGAQLSPTAGLALDAQLSDPIWIAVDASGNLWISNSSSSTLTVLLGLASPVRTPLLGPAVSP